MHTDRLPSLHEKEKISIEAIEKAELDIAFASHQEAKTLIRQMERRVTGLDKATQDLQLPPNENGRGRWSFNPKMMRLDLNEETISCFGFYTNDDSLFLIQVRYLVNRPEGEIVRFEISSFFNPKNPIDIRLVF